MQLTNFILAAFGRGCKWIMFAIWGVAALFILFYAAIGLYMSYIEIPASHKLRADASAINGRGDEVTARTERIDTARFRTKTVIRLKPAHDWFATTLLTVQSDDYLVGFKWPGDDRLVLILDFGCSAKMTDPVTSVGPIKIVYRFDREISLPDHGYSSFPRDAPRKPCT